MCQANATLKEIIKTFDGECVVTERVMKHPKNGENQLYLSFSNGQDVCGFFVGSKKKEDIIKFLTAKKGASRGRSNGNDNNGND